MSAFCLCRMRGARMTNPLFLLLLLSSLTATAKCQYGEDGTDAEAATEEEETGDPDPDGGHDTEISEPAPMDPDSTSATDTPPIDDGISETIEEKQGSGLDSSNNGDEEIDSTSIPEDDDDGLSPIVILIPVVLVVLIIGMVVGGILINRRWNQQARNQELRKQDPYLDGSSTEKVPMPMFEEDVPSVLELEMEELGQWRKKDGETAEESMPA